MSSIIPFAAFGICNPECVLPTSYAHELSIGAKGNLSSSNMNNFSKA